MNFEFGNGKIIINIIKYLYKILENFMIKFNNKTKMRTLASMDLFDKIKTKKLNKD